ncbi:MAG: hypothetical protein GYA23_13795 [Methanomicrobiales archaeon]|nr:hypothetical protein [Methanomicrobiales archaeon]
MNLPPVFKRVLPTGSDLTPPVIGLIIANLVTIGLAILQNWDTATILFTFWLQSIIIGLFSAVKLLTADTALLAEELGKAEEWTGRGPVASRGRVWTYKILVAGFFLFHYGLFHLFYYFLFFYEGEFGPVEYMAGSGGIICGIFFLSHLFSFLFHNRTEKRGGDYMAMAILIPYNRIVPMHLTMIIGGMIAAFLQLIGIETVLPLLVVFLLLKMYMDVRMHIVLHNREAHPDVSAGFIWF